MLVIIACFGGLGSLIGVKDSDFVGRPEAETS
jgi:hypothetical protein